ncbi:MAG: AMP-binding protein, partial [Rubrivivax sp.]|nr:AMP-binding protein [Rubrivivax sp.]
MAHTAHVDTFARDHLPPPSALPELLFELPELQLPERLNVATELLDRWVQQGQGARLCIQGEGVRWTYADLQERANRIAHVLVADMGLVPGNRVLLRGANSPMLAACWFGVIKAGGIAVGTMPLLRERELEPIVDKGRITHALCDARLAEALDKVRASSPHLRQVRLFNGDGGAGSLEAAMAARPAQFDTLDTAADDTALIAFTSGTTGVPKGTMHFHRDVIAACRAWPPHVLRPEPDDVFIGSPPLAFTFGLGGLLMFPMAIGASTVLLEKASPEALLPAIARYKASVCFTAPTSYRVMAGQAAQHDLASLRKCVSAGEALPAATRLLWKQATGIELIDGIGSTEMFHIFISADEQHAKPG